ncbi:hypothetical protein D3C73_612690 [compost metagenome]
MALAMSSSKFERCCGVVRDQPAKARWAARMAASTCSVLASAICVRTSPVAGLRIGSTQPCPATNSPSINKAVNNGVCAPAIFRVLFSCVAMLLPLSRAPAVLYRCSKTSARTRGRQILNTEGGVRLNRWLASAVGLFPRDGEERVDQCRARRATTPGQADVEGLAEVGNRPRFDDVALQ